MKGDAQVNARRPATLAGAEFDSATSLDARSMPLRPEAPCP